MTQAGGEIERELEHISALLQREDVPAALARLNDLPWHRLDPGTQVRAGLLRARAHLSERRFGALRACLGELRHATTDREPQREIELLEAHGEALAGNAREAFSASVRILRDTSPFEEGHARATYVAGLCLFRRGHYRWARRQLEKAAAFYRLSGDRIGLSFMLNNLALLEKSVGRIDVALGYFDEAARLLPTEEYVRHHCRLLGNRGICFLKLGRVKDARVCFLQARSLAIRSPDLFIEVAINNNLGHTYRIEGDYEAALACYTLALEDARNAASARQECLSLEFLGELLGEMGRLEEAAEYLDRAYNMAAKLAPQGDLMMEVLRRRGELFASMGRDAQARGDLERAINLCHARGEKRELVLAERALILLGEKAPDFEARIRAVVDNLRSLGDRFEFVRTVCVLLQRDPDRLRGSEWLREIIGTAVHHADDMGIEFWKKQLQELGGYSRPVFPARVRLSGRSDLFLDTGSRAYRRCLEAASLAAQSDSPVLIIGETGVGKEIIARLVHDQSSRAPRPMVAINCGALPENLVESELFGHARGTFTGAHRDKDGLLEAAREGTVLLDEIGELPLPIQVKLLRFLDSGEFRRVGETRARRSGVRVIAATNRDLEELVRSSRFREDLFYRLNVFQIDVPPLRLRREDILPLAEFFWKQTHQSSSAPELSRGLRDWLCSYEWPGNVRELKNLCEYLVTKAWGKTEIAYGDLPTHLRRSAATRSVTTPGVPALLAAGHPAKFELEKKELEREQIIEALKASQGRILHAAKLLGMSRNTVSQRMKQLGIARESFRP